MRTVGIFLSFFLGITSTLSSTVIKTDFAYTEQVAASNQQADSLSSMEKFVDSRFKLLAADFQDQIDDLKGKVVKLEGSRDTLTTMGVTKEQHEHQINKRQAYGKKTKSAVCENSSSFCTYFYPDHPDTTNRKKGNYPSTVTNEMIEEPPAVTGIPTSCRDLQLLGHKLNGLYLIKVPRPDQGAKIETVYCDFKPTTKDAVSQNFIGNMEVKTRSIHFYVQRKTVFRAIGTVIPFELEQLNEGGAFNLESGVFTVPVAGIYHFQASAVKLNTVMELFIHLQVNGAVIGEAVTNQLYMGSYDVVSMSSSLKLAANDRVNLYLAGGMLCENDKAHQTHFVGWLVEEDLM